jgi:hypothetical protein
MNTALGNETATSVQCLLFTNELRTIKFGSRVHKYTIVIRPVPLCEGLFISELPDIFTPNCDEEEATANDETLQPSTPRNPEFSLQLSSPQSHKITQNVISDLIKDL